MSKVINEFETDNARQEGENLNPAEPASTPLQQVRAQQSLLRESREVGAQPDTSPEIVGASIPSDKRHHPQRQMYSGGTADSETI